MQIMRNGAKQIKNAGEDGVCAVFSAEMSGSQLVIRLASEMCGVNSHAFRLGLGDPADIAKVRNQIDEIEELPIWIDDGSAPSTKIMLDRLGELNSTMPVRCMMFDFVELGGDEGSTEELRIASIHKSLKAIAKTLHIPVIGLCQVARDVEKTSSKVPQMHHLRYSGMAEQVADKVATLMRPDYYTDRGETVTDVPAERMTGCAYVNIVKFRDGPVGGVWMQYEKQFARFGDLHTERTVFE
jgi:replicative DNA helicase